MVNNYEDLKITYVESALKEAKESVPGISEKYSDFAETCMRIGWDGGWKIASELMIGIFKALHEQGMEITPEKLEELFKEFENTVEEE